ncbi:MAG TPA: hypothetical protein VGR71_00920 [Nitrospira sp.]|nr:hypothetical protein [Nitrospira sp.]
MTAKFKIGDKVIVPEGTQGARSWWVGKPTVVRVVFEDIGLYEVLFQDAEDFAFIEEHLLAPLDQSSPGYVAELHNTAL